MRTRRLPLLLVLTLLFAGCTGPLTGDDGPPPDVLVTHYPIQFLTTEIAGDDLRIDAFVEGTQAHHFEPTIQDRVNVDEARLIIYQGAMFDPWVEDLIQAAGDQAPHTLELASTVDLIDHAHDEDEGHDEDEDHDSNAHAEPDPHTWVDPLNMVHHANAINDALQDAFPQHQDAFENRTQTLVDDLETLHEAYRTHLSTCETRTIVVNHNAFAYLGQRHNITIEAVHGLNPDAEPSAETIDRLVTLVDEHNLTTVFFEEFVSPGVIETIAQETGAKTRMLSPLEALSTEQRDAGEDYITLMGTNLDHLVNAMRCTTPEA